MVYNAARVDDKFNINELLCFFINKAPQGPIDKLMKACLFFYKWEDTASARNVLMSDNRSLESHLLKSEGPEKDKSTLEDILKISVKLPKSVTASLIKVPSVGIENMNMVSVFKELISIRKQIKEFLDWQREINGKLANRLDDYGYCRTDATGSDRI